MVSNTYFLYEFHGLWYEITYKNIENEKKETSKSIIMMIGELTGSTDDIEGLKEFRRYMEVKDE